MSTTSAIDFGSLIGAQLSALIDAEAEGAEKSAEYIESVGFEELEDGTLKLRMIAFEMQRLDLDGEIRAHTIQIPMLTLIPIPLLTISEADLEFDLHIESVVQEKIKTEESPSRGRIIKSTLKSALLERSEISSKKPRARLLTRLAKTSKGTAKAVADLSMKIKIIQSPFPIGIERLINIADLSVEDKADEQAR